MCQDLKELLKENEAEREGEEGTQALPEGEESEEEGA